MYHIHTWNGDESRGSRTKGHWDKRPPVKRPQTKGHWTKGHSSFTLIVILHTNVAFSRMNICLVLMQFLHVFCYMLYRVNLMLFCNFSIPLLPIYHHCSAHKYNESTSTLICSWLACTHALQVRSSKAEEEQQQK